MLWDSGAIATQRRIYENLRGFHLHPLPDTLPPAAPDCARAPSKPHELRLVVAHDFGELTALRTQWNQLAARAGTNTIFQTFEMHACWWKAFGDGLRLHAPLAFDGDRLVGIAPLVIAEQRIAGLRRRMLQFIGARSFDYADFIVEPGRKDVLALLLERLAQDEAAFDLLYLRDVPGASETIPALRLHFGKRDIAIDVRELYKAPTRIFNDPEADRRLPNKTSLRRHHKHFDRSGKLEFTARLSPADARRYLEPFFEQHVRRRSATDAPSVFVDARARIFFAALVDALAPHDWLLFSVVTFNGAPIAMHFGFEYGGTITWYKPSFDLELAKHSPGEVLLKYLLEYALESKAAELDFTIGEEQFKNRFANEVRTNYAVRAYRRRRDYHLNRMLLGARAFVESRPALNRIARRLAGSWRRKSWL